MNKIVLIAGLFLFLRQRSLSQERLIVCSNERNADNSYIIWADSKASAEYTVRLNFVTLTGYSTTLTGYNATASPVYFKTVNPGRTQLTRLTPMTNSFSGHMFNYTYQYFPGRPFNRSPDTNVVYLMPATAGNALRVAKVSSIEERLGQERTEEFHAAGFIYKLGDTICASRAGTVYIATDDDKEGEKKTQTYTDKRNKIAIEHRDGTLGHYSILAPVQLLVAPGDLVLPGQPIAIFNKESDKYHVFMAVTYLEEKKLTGQEIGSGEKRPSLYTELPMQFFTAENHREPLQVHNTYIVAHPKEVIVAELSKKEKKKLGL
jgi:hypothetical protein